VALHFDAARALQVGAESPDTEAKRARLARRRRFPMRRLAFLLALPLIGLAGFGLSFYSPHAAQRQANPSSAEQGAPQPASIEGGAATSCVEIER
jgi:hypothetical protein